MQFKPQSCLLVAYFFIIDSASTNVWIFEPQKLLIFG